MKRLILVILIASGLHAMAQNNDASVPAYKRFPTLPPLQLLLGDSLTKFTKANFLPGKNVLIMLFSPECEHCQHEAEELLKYKDSLQNIQVVMATMFPIWQMNEFQKNYKLNTIPNLVMGKDIYFFIPGFYTVHSLPFLAMYNKKGELISVFEGSMPLNRVLETFRSAKG